MTRNVYRYVLEERAVDSLLFLSVEEQDYLLAYFRLLAAQPNAESEAWSLDEAGRKNFANTSGPFTVVHWADHATREVRIVEFMRS
ncbi:MAG: hypothetical protein ABIZ81_08710 [Opitutaceae bacterium]